MLTLVDAVLTNQLWSNEVRVALSPSRAYRGLLAIEAPAVTWRWLRRPALILFVIAAVAPIAAVGRVTFGLVATMALCWSFAVAIQIVVGTCVIASAPARRARGLRALDLWFAGHLPYSLWVFVSLTMLAADAGPVGVAIVAAVVPAAWTAVIVSGFCRTVLGTTAAGARWRAGAHFVATWVIMLTYIG